MLKLNIQNLGIKAFNKMQIETLEAIKTNKNVVLHSKTGSGKTLAFLASIIQEIKPNISNQIQSIVVVPTRELAIQIEEVLKTLKTSLKINVAYGGHSTQIEKNNFSSPPSILIGTPGRLAYHCRNSNVDISQIEFIVLDEFDKCLEYGFEKDMKEIFSYIHHRDKLILSSATKLEQLNEFLKIDKFKVLDFTDGKTTTSKVSVKVVEFDKEDKLDVLSELVNNIADKSTIIFCNHREAVDRISEYFFHERIVFDQFHGGMKQDERERSLIKFRNGSTNVLVATDLAARGIDVSEVENVIHYQLPLKQDAFIHRNGRTGRVDASGNVFIMKIKKLALPSFMEVSDYENFIPNPSKSKNIIPEMLTLYIDKGKKDKVNKIDLVGFFFKQTSIEKNDLGKINVLDHTSFIAMNRFIANDVIKEVKGKKIKGKKVNIKLSK
jgi:ATP-dependent RNA helicase DbpA